MIKLATLADIPSIITLVREQAANYLGGKELEFSSRKTAQLAQQSIQYSLCVINLDKNNKLKGVCFGIESFNIFSETAKEINLIVLYGKQSGLLIKEYLSIVDNKMLEDNNILCSWFSFAHAANIKASSMKKLGYKLTEYKFIKER